MKNPTSIWKLHESSKGTVASTAVPKNVKKATMLHYNNTNSEKKRKRGVLPGSFLVFWRYCFDARELDSQLCRRAPLLSYEPGMNRTLGSCELYEAIT
jgi:hypothetical protein